MKRTANNMSIRYKVIDDIIKKEGGYVNNPADSGGETNFGITKTVALENGYKGPMKDMAVETAFKIYETVFWKRNKLDVMETISTELVEKLADIAINMGSGAAGKFLQRCLNVFNLKQSYYPDLKVDGDIGNKTVEALKAFVKIRKDEGIKVLVSSLKCLQGAFYIGLAEERQKDEEFVYGWIRSRV